MNDNDLRKEAEQVDRWTALYVFSGQYNTRLFLPVLLRDSAFIGLVDVIIAIAIAVCHSYSTLPGHMKSLPIQVHSTHY